MDWAWGRLRGTLPLVVVIIYLINQGRCKIYKGYDGVFCYALDQKQDDSCLGCLPFWTGNQALRKAVLNEANPLVKGTAKIGLVKYNGKYLFGWTHISVTFPEQVSGVQIVGETSDINSRASDHHAYHGQFVTFNAKYSPTCPAQSPFVTHPKDYERSCALVTDPALEVANTFAFSNGGKHNQICAFHRMNFPPCQIFSENKGPVFFFRIIGAGENGGNYIGWTPKFDTIKYKWWAYGAADPVPPLGASVTVEYVTNSTNVPWIQEIQSETYFEHTGNNKDKSICYVKDNGAFHGRCIRTNTARGNTGPQNVHMCGKQENWSKFPLITEFYQNVTKNQCLQYEIHNDCKKFDKTFKSVGISLFNGIGTYVWAFRKSHGVFMAIAGLFLLPVADFVARYYKETFMDTRLIHVHAWYFVHSIVGVLGVGAILIGGAGGYYSRTFLGFPLESWSWIHAILGYIVILAILLSIALNSIRRYPRPERLITISIHALTGYIGHILGIVVIGFTAFMHGSPTTLYQSCTGEGLNIDCNTSLTSAFGLGTLGIVIVKLAVDIGFNFFAWTELNRVDKLDNTARHFATVVPIPVVRPSATSSRQGASLRVVLLAVYVLINLILTIAMCCIILLRSSHNIFAGASSTTHFLDGTLKPNLQGFGDLE